MSTTPIPSCNSLLKENELLLDELEKAYRDLEVTLEQSAHEREIAYKELQEKYKALEKAYQELSNKENMLIHLEKLSSIGQFMAEIIHELKSPLAAIAGHAQLLLMEDPPEEHRHRVERIISEADKMSNQLMGFMNMTYKEEHNYRDFDVNAALTESISLLEIIKPDSVQIASKLSPSVLTVRGDPDQICQVSLNLAKNAFDAMDKKGGRLEIKTDAMLSSDIDEIPGGGGNQCQSLENWRQILRQWRIFAVTSFADNGCGIAADKLAHIFKPFYTTKERKKGTGLGLSICSDIAKRHKGNLTVHSTVGVGTTFRLYLPLAK